MKTQTTIQAKISNKAINKVTRFFNAGIDDILHELLQNARRAKATAVHLILTEPQDGNPATLTLKDDGQGIADPQQLLSFGDSGWSATIQTREDPAGMGVFSLANRGATIRSHDWQVTLKPEHFAGEGAAEVVPAQPISGTEIEFEVDKQEASAVNDVQISRYAWLIRVMLYYPLPIYLNGKPLKQTDYLQDALHTEKWHGLKIAVGKWHPNKCFTSTGLNFHGLVLQTSLPEILSYRVRIDVQDCPQLKLVLPARKEVVQDAFWQQLQLECKRVLYRYIAMLIDGHSLKFAEWQEARNLGITLPEAEPVLRAFAPQIRDDILHVEPAPLERFPGNAVLTDCFPERNDDIALEQCFWLAVTHNLTTDNNALDPARFYRPNADYAGYSWYDALPKLTEIFVDTVSDGKVLAPHEHKGHTGVDKIRMTCTLATNGGDEEQHSLTAPIYIFTEEVFWNLGNCCVLLSKEATFNDEDLADILRDCCFQYADDGDYDSYDTQLDSFMHRARSIARSMLMSENEALIAKIQDILIDHLKWEMPEDCTALIRASRYTVPTVKLVKTNAA